MARGNMQVKDAVLCTYLSVPICCTQLIIVYLQELAPPLRSESAEVHALSDLQDRYVIYIVW